ncbi:tRNA (N(6)-L-threonylcarbamoyladenosine(37)-C(2))-methylthiotransferase MtaB [Bacteroidota bacterium]
MASKVAFHTLGCKLNFSETSTICEQFIEKGFHVVDFKERADVYIINTCTVTENADKECRQIIRRALRNNPDAFIAVTGCYAQLSPDELSEIQGVDVILGTNEKFDIFSYADNFEKKELSCIHVTPTEEINSVHTAHSTEADGRTRAFLKIQDGCDYKCSFCTIPLARGKSRSLETEIVLSEFQNLLDSGYKEIVLTGVNVGDYGKVLDKDFYALLKEIIKIPGDFRVRISSIEPNLLTDDIIKLTAENEKLCDHFHIPLQSGSPKILKLMQRRYTNEDYKNVIFKAVDLINDVGIGVDVIVGFPGETEDDFLDTYNFLLNLPISYLHVFTYSERANTKAISMDGNVDVVERKRRNNMLRILSEKKRNEFYKKMIGKNLPVLFESERHGNFIKGFASNYVRVQHPSEAGLSNKFVKVKIKEADKDICTVDLI